MRPAPRERLGACSKLLMVSGEASQRKWSTAQSICDVRRGNAKFTNWSCPDRDFHIHIVFAPQEGDPGQPVLGANRFSRTLPFFGRKRADLGRELRSGDFSPDGAGRNFRLRVISDAFVLARIAAGHEVQLAVLFGEPDRRVHSHTAFAEGCQTDILLAVNLGWESCKHTLLYSDRASMAGSRGSARSAADCPDAVLRVTSATCANGCASACSAAKNLRSQNPANPRKLPCSQRILRQTLHQNRPLSGKRASPKWKRRRRSRSQQPNHRRNNPERQEHRPPGRRHDRAVAEVEAGVDEKVKDRAQLERRPLRRGNHSLRKLLRNHSQQRPCPPLQPARRRARSFLRLGFRVRGKVRGSSATTLRRSPATSSACSSLMMLRNSASRT